MSATPRTIWTLGDNPQQVTEGEVWHMKIGSSVKVCKVLQLTGMTIKVMEMPFSYIQPLLEHNRITFLSRVEPEEKEEE